MNWQEKARTELAGLKLSFKKPMADLTTFKIGGPIDLLVEPNNTEELERILVFCLDNNLPWLTIGSGSNLLVRDGGIRGIGIKLAGEFERWEIKGTVISAGTAVSLSKLAKETAEQGLTGLEFACGIPGTVGGGIYMNAGAYNGEMAEIVNRVQTVQGKQGVCRFDKKDLKFGYRFSRFQQETDKVIARLFSKY
jgi:UDP-N-acetylmuramate dehydrogenase